MIPSLTPTNIPTFSPTFSIDYSCLHLQSWLLNANNNNDFSNTFNSNTDILTSYGTAGISSNWAVTTNQIPFYSQNFTAAIIATLNGRPRASIDFSGSSGHTTAIIGHYYSFGSDIGYVSGTCGSGYWPDGTAVCPIATSASLTFPLKPAPEISVGKY